MKWIKTFAVHIALIILTVVAIFTAVSYVLRSATRHGDALTVPDITGVPVENAIQLLNERKLRYLIIDSLYFDDKPKLSVLDQNPSPESKVKEGRIIYLVINADKAPLVMMPNLIDVSLRQAEAMLKSAGLKAGQLVYKPDLAQNVVLEQQVNGRNVPPGYKLPKGSAVDLVLGDGMVDAVDVPLPNLIDLTYEEARNLLTSQTLNTGAVVFQGVITDSSGARIYRQVPAYSTDATLKAGSTVDIFLKQ
ncbi:MAG: PASTA domain-containing protein [Bacteroidota bacterium]|jgi:beta-lactam-binding protein with PASTA domain